MGLSSSVLLGMRVISLLDESVLETSDIAGQEPLEESFKGVELCILPTPTVIVGADDRSARSLNSLSSQFCWAVLSSMITIPLRVDVAPSCCSRSRRC